LTWYSLSLKSDLMHLKLKANSLTSFKCGSYYYACAPQTKLRHRAFLTAICVSACNFCRICNGTNDWRSRFSFVFKQHLLLVNCAVIFTDRWCD
jgi:hypothetical protein